MNRIKSFVTLIAVVLLVAAASLAQAQSSLWNVTNGDWSNSANWLSGPWNYSNNLGDGTIIDNGGTANITTTVSELTGNGNIYLGDAGGNGWINMTAGQMNSSSATPTNYYFGIAAGSGVFTQSGGINVPFSGATGTSQGYYSSLSSAIKTAAMASTTCRAES